MYLINRFTTFEELSDEYYSICRLRNQMKNIDSYSVSLNGEYGIYIRIRYNDTKFEMYQTYSNICTRLMFELLDEHTKGYHIHNGVILSPQDFENMVVYGYDLKVDQKKHCHIIPSEFSAVVNKGKPNEYTLLQTKELEFTITSVLDYTIDYTNTNLKKLKNI